MKRQREPSPEWRMFGEDLLLLLQVCSAALLVGIIIEGVINQTGGW
jgi:hypothetical protein